MSNDLQQQHEDMRIVREMLTHLQELYDEQSHTARFEVSRKFFRAKMYNGQSVNDSLFDNDQGHQGASKAQHEYG